MKGDEPIDGWIGGEMNEWRSRWIMIKIKMMDEWMDRWMVERINR